MTTANPRAMVMPPRPQKDPMNINKSVRATSKTVVRKTLIISFYSTIACIYSTRARSARSVELNRLGSKLNFPATPLPSRLDTRRGRGLFLGLPFKPHHILLPIALDDHMIARQHPVFKNLQRQRI